MELNMINYGEILELEEILPLGNIQTKIIVV
jgi:hypothetical protein